MAIIDDGVPFFLPKKFHDIKVFHFTVNKNKIVENKYSQALFKMTHGGLCFLEYIKNLKQREIEIYSINVIGRKERRGDIHKLITALEWCIKNDIKLINMSIGTTRFWDYDLLKPFFKQLDAQQKIVIAAHSNQYIFSYPAISRYAIGVRFDDRKILLPNTYYLIDDIITNSEVIMSKMDIKDLGKYVNLEEECNSFAAPLLAAKITQLLLEKNGNREEILERLRRNSIKNINLWQLRKKYIKKGEAEIPMVLVECKNMDIIAVLNALSTKLKENKYCVFSIISEDLETETSCLNLNMILKNCENNIKKSIRFIQCYSNADILLVQNNVELIDQSNIKQLFDIIISDKDDFCNIGVETLFLKNIKEIDDLFSQLLEKLT